MRYPAPYDSSTDPWHEEEEAIPEPGFPGKLPPASQPTPTNAARHTGPWDPSWAEPPPWAITQEVAADLLSQSSTIQGHAAMQQTQQQTQQHTQQPAPAETEAAASTPPEERATLPATAAESAPHKPAADTGPDPQPDESNTPPTQSETPEQQAQQQAGDDTQAQPTEATTVPQQGRDTTQQRHQQEHSQSWGRTRTPPARSSRRSEATAGHGSQRVQNKAGKYTYKQHNKRGNWQMRPPPQQGGPGWGLLYKPQVPQQQSTQGDWGNDPASSSQQQPSSSNDNPNGPPHTPLPERGTKAYNEARERFAGLLNKHLLPRDNTPADNKPTQQATQPPPTTGDSPTEPTSATQQQNPDTTAREAAQPLQPPQGTAPATEQPMDEAEEEDTHCDGSPFTAEERAIQAEWAAGQEGTFWSGVVHTWEDGDDIPPSVPLSSNSHADMTQLTHGCWRIEVRPDKGVSIRRIAGIPRTVIEGDEGETLSSPPFPVGLEATFAPMTPHHWILTVTATPALSNYEAASMLLTVGDKILFERDTITLVWRMRIESQCKDCHPTITRMRQRREEAREREQQQEAQQQATAAAHHSTASSSGGKATNVDVDVDLTIPD